jgi:hypothetical protein
MQSRLLFKTLTILIISVFFLVSCGLPPPGTPLTPEQREEAKKKCILQYVGAGLVLGGITGALIGGGKRGGVGAAIGAVAGGALGYLVAYGKCIVYFSDLNTFPVAGYQDTARNEGYRPDQGNVVKIKSWSTTPSEVAPGSKLKLNGSYYVMAPKELKEVKVKEMRTLYFYDTTKMEWVELGPAENEVTAALGTRKADGMIDIPKDLPEGKYRIDLKVAALGKEDVASTQYIVKKSVALDSISPLFALNVDVNEGE